MYGVFVNSSLESQLVSLMTMRNNEYCCSDSINKVMDLMIN